MKMNLVSYNKILESNGLIIPRASFNNLKGDKMQSYHFLTVCKKNF